MNYLVICSCVFLCGYWPSYLSSLVFLLSFLLFSISVFAPYMKDNFNFIFQTLCWYFISSFININFQYLIFISKCPFIKKICFSFLNILLYLSSGINDNFQNFFSLHIFLLKIHFSVSFAFYFRSFP